MVLARLEQQIQTSTPAPVTIPSPSTPRLAPTTVGGGAAAPLLQKVSITPTSIPAPVTTPSPSTPMPAATAAGGGGTVVAMLIPSASTTTPPSTQAQGTTPSTFIPSLLAPTPTLGPFAIAPLIWAQAMTTSA